MTCDAQRRAGKYECTEFEIVDIEDVLGDCTKLTALSRKRMTGSLDNHVLLEKIDVMISVVRTMKINLDNDLKVLIDEGESQEDILDFLFSKGLAITDAIVVVRSLYCISLNEAKNVVATSRCWGGVHRENKNLHDASQEIAEAVERVTAVSKENMNALNVIAPYKHMDM